MAELIFTTDAFSPNGTPEPGVPMLLDGDMRLVEPACAWLMHVALVRGRTRSRETWRTYAEALYDWWQTLEANGWSWDAIGVSEIADYRDHMLRTPSTRTGRPYAHSTINGRLRILSLFYRWCANRGLIESAPFSTSELAVWRSRPPGFLSHVDASGGRQTVNELALRHTPALPRPLSPQVIRRILTGVRVRDRLIVEWAVTTGLRRMEIAGLRLRALPGGGAESMTAVQVDTTKGGKARFIYPPSPLLDRTWAYVREERSVAVRRAQSRSTDYAEPDTLFLTNRGAPMTARRVGAMFADAATRAGVEACFHALRHTFASVMLGFLQQKVEQGADLNPLLTLQTLLGHSDLSTTAVYLHASAADLSPIERSIDDLYQALT